MAYPYRTTPEVVQSILGSDYDTANMPDLTPRIRAANLLVSRVATCASDKGVPLTTGELTEIEAWLAAWYYTKTDPVYLSRSTAGRSGAFVRGKEEPEPYKDGALALDPSGCLNALLNRRRAMVAWGGKVEADQIDVDQRSST